jgi:hypothetical protein
LLWKFKRVARERKLKETLNLRLDAPLAKEIRRLAQAKGRSESDVARTLLGYGAEVERRLEASALSRAFAWREDATEKPRPEIVEIEARWRPMTGEEIDELGLGSYVESAERDAERE